jgi:hypothetical protein
MELTFEQIDGYWISEFEVTSDFNLHIERDTEGRLDIYQRTAGGRYEYINDIGYLEKRLVYDYDFSALVYPKFIKIKSKVKPLICTITTDGEINELKYQEKTLEITSNGTTKVTADTGYNALASVNVKVNVPTEGGGESMKFYNVSQLTASNNPDKIYSIVMCGMLVKLNISNSIVIMSGASIAGDTSLFDKIIAIGVDLSQKIILSSGEGSFADAISPILSEINEITKEEFYRLPKSYGIINANPDGNGEEYKDFFEDAWSYLTANAPTNTYIPFVPYPVEYLKIVHPNGGYDEFGSKARAALWHAGESGDGRYYQQIQVDDNMSVFIKNTYSDGTIEYLFELHI